MSYRTVCAVALVAYAAAVLLGAASGHMSPVTFSILDVPRALVAVLLAFGVLLRHRLVDLIAVAYIVWFGIWGVLAILGPLYQFVVPDSAGMRIIPDSVRSGVALASEVALIAAGVALSGNARARRAADGRMS